MAAILDSDRNDFSYFWSTSHPHASYWVEIQVSWPFGSGEEAKNRYLRRPPKWPFRISPIGTILAIFYLQVTSMLSTEFQVNWPFGSGEEAKNRFSRWPPWISDRNDFSYFWSTIILMLPTKFQVNCLSGLGDVIQRNCWRQTDGRTTNRRRTQTLCAQVS